MAIIETQYEVRGFRSGESDPRGDVTILLGPGHDPSVVDPDVLTEAVRDHVATLEGIISVQVRKVTTDVTETVVAPL